MQIHVAFLQVIDLSGYTIDEKMVIAKQHIIPNQIKEHGLMVTSPCACVLPVIQLPTHGRDGRSC